MRSNGNQQTAAPITQGNNAIKIEMRPKINSPGQGIPKLLPKCTTKGIAYPRDPPKLIQKCTPKSITSPGAPKIVSEMDPEIDYLIQALRK